VFGPSLLSGGFTKLFEQHAGNILNLWAPYGETDEVKSLQEEYNQVLRQAQVFDQLHRPIFAMGSDKEKEERKYIRLRISMKRCIDQFRYHAADISAKIEKGELKLVKAEPGKKPGKKKPGRHKVEEAEAVKRRKYNTDWKRASEAKVSKDDFCGDEGIEVEYLNNSVLRWCRDHPQ